MKAVASSNSISKNRFSHSSTKFNLIFLHVLIFFLFKIRLDCHVVFTRCSQQSQSRSIYANDNNSSSFNMQNNSSKFSLDLTDETQNQSKEAWPADYVKSEFKLQFLSVESLMNKRNKNLDEN